MVVKHSFSGPRVLFLWQKQLNRTATALAGGKRKDLSLAVRTLLMLWPITRAYRTSGTP